MKVNILLALDNRRPKKDGTFPLVFRIYRNNSFFPISTGHSLLEKDWDEKKRAIKSSYKGSNSIVWLNNSLAKQKASYVDIIGKLSEAKELTSLSNLQLKGILVGEKMEICFFQYTQKLIDDLISIRKVGNARIYKSVLNVLKTYRNNRDLRFEELNYEFLKQFETMFFKTEGNSVNGLSVYLRTIRAIYNKAIKEGIVKEEYYPFKNYTIKTESTQKRAISAEKIKQIELLKFEEEHPLFHTHQYFLLSFYLMGISFTDLAHLKKDNIIDGRIQFSRQKTNRKYDIAITGKSKQIIDYYLSRYSESEYIFPIINRKNPVEQYKDVEWARSRYNKKLSKIAELFGIEQNLTSYVSRHSFATLAKNKGIPITAISEMLGHESVKTTQVYLDSLPSDMIDKYHRDILGD
jgi:integrase/recombinase XerD